MTLTLDSNAVHNGFKGPNKKLENAFRASSHNSFYFADKRTVLTAAHCLLDENRKELGRVKSVRLGEFDLDNNSGNEVVGNREFVRKKH